GGYGVQNLMYDSLEAPHDVPIHQPLIEGESPEDQAKRTLETVAATIRAVRGDSHWVDPESFAQFVVDSRTPPSEARRFAYNQITAAEDSWADPNHIQYAVRKLEESPADEWVLFFDGSKSDDSTGLVASRLSDGHVVTLGVWQKPTGGRGDGWVVDRYDVDLTVRRELDSRKVVAFFADPSHAKDDEGFGYWDSVIDGWHRDYGDQLELWAVPSGPNRHSIMWDM